MKKVIKVYLAGGMRSGWQDTVMAAIRERLPHVPVIFIDPRQNGTSDADVYTAWDLHAVEVSDMVFSYLEADNPGGPGLACEVGFACGMARAGARPKTLVTVIEPGHPSSRYYDMVRTVSDFEGARLEQGIAALIGHLTSAVCA